MLKTLITFHHFKTQDLWPGPLVLLRPEAQRIGMTQLPRGRAAQLRGLTEAEKTLAAVENLPHVQCTSTAMVQMEQTQASLEGESAGWQVLSGLLPKILMGSNPCQAGQRGLSKEGVEREQVPFLSGVRKCPECKKQDQGFPRYTWKPAHTCQQQEVSGQEGVPGHMHTRHVQFRYLPTRHTHQAHVHRAHTDQACTHQAHAHQAHADQACTHTHTHTKHMHTGHI